MKEYKRLDKLLEELGFIYIPHRGTEDTFIKDNIEIKIPYLTISNNGKISHIVPVYMLDRINEILEEYATKKD